MYKVNEDRKLNKLNEYRVNGKLYGYYTECGKLTNYNVNTNNNR